MFVSTLGEQKQLLFESAHSVNVLFIHGNIIWTCTVWAESPFYLLWWCFYNVWQQWTWTRPLAPSALPPHLRSPSLVLVLVKELLGAMKGSDFEG